MQEEYFPNEKANRTIYTLLDFDFCTFNVQSVRRNKGIDFMDENAKKLIRNNGPYARFPHNNIDLFQLLHTLLDILLGVFQEKDQFQMPFDGFTNLIIQQIQLMRKTKILTQELIESIYETIIKASKEFDNAIKEIEEKAVEENEGIDKNNAMSSEDPENEDFKKKNKQF